MSSFPDAKICRSIIDRRPTGLRVVARQNKIVFWSKAAEPIMGHLRHGVIHPVTQVRRFAYPRRRKPDASTAPSNRRISVIVQYLLKNNDEEQCQARYR
jgi:hypothetical protein